MAFIKFTNNPYPKFQDMMNVLHYSYKNAELLTVFNGSNSIEGKENVYYDFMLTKLQDSPKMEFKSQCYHFIQKFDPKDVISMDMAYKIGCELVERLVCFKELEIMLATHPMSNMEHIHNHYIINISKPEHEMILTSDVRVMIRDVSDNICREQGLIVLSPFPYRKEVNDEKENKI